MCVGGWEAGDEGVTRQFAGRNAACVVMPNRAANATFMSGRWGLQKMRRVGSWLWPATRKWTSEGGQRKAGGSSG